MTPEAWALVVAALVGLWLHHLWHVRRYPDRACRTCGGSGKATSADMFGRKVIGLCHRCKGEQPTTPRRWWSR